MSIDFPKLVDAWLGSPDKGSDVPEYLDSFLAFDFVFSLMRESPEDGWQFLLEASRRELSPKRASMLSAGPLEDLLANHGTVIIQKVELEAKQNPAFRNLLSGVWQNQTPSPIWTRVKLAAKPQ